MCCTCKTAALRVNIQQFIRPKLWTIAAHILNVLQLQPGSFIYGLFLNIFINVRFLIFYC